MITGDILSFGKFQWRILEEKKDKVLILADDIIDQRDYHDSKEEITWEKSEIRKYLNNVFIDTFSTIEKKSILETINTNNNNPWYNSLGGNNTHDRVFLLSIDEVVRQYFGDSSRLLDNPKDNQRYWFERKDVNNIYRQAKLLNSSWWWWTRSPGKNNRVATYIHGDGNIGIQGNGISNTTFNTLHKVTNSNKGGIRPALWIKK